MPMGIKMGMDICFLVTIEPGRSLLTVRYHEASDQTIRGKESGKNGILISIDTPKNQIFMLILNI